MDLLLPFIMFSVPLVIFITVTPILQVSSAEASTRVVYYLHTKAATWNEASGTCASYGGVLISMVNFHAANNSVRYVDSDSWDNALDNLPNGFWAGLYRNTTGFLRWQGCTDYDASQPLPEVTPAAGASATSCYVSNSALQLSPLACQSKRPYICQRDDGQCWFQPYVDTMIVDSDSSSHSIVNTTITDEADCAKLCRSSIGAGFECWAFSFQGTSSCHVHFTSVPHKYALFKTATYFHAAADVTAYVKICTGGWATGLAPSLTDGSTTAKNENCTVTAVDDWDSAVCYCECDQPPIILEAETLVMTIEEKVDQIVKELQMDPQNTSSTRRKKISVEDSRPSAQSIGYMGVGFLVIVFGGIFLMDANIIFSHAAKICKSLKPSNQSDA